MGQPIAQRLELYPQVAEPASVPPFGVGPSGRHLAPNSLDARPIPFRFRFQEENFVRLNSSVDQVLTACQAIPKAFVRQPFGDLAQRDPVPAYRIRKPKGPEHRASGKRCPNRYHGSQFQPPRSLSCLARESLIECGPIGPCPRCVLSRREQFASVFLIRRHGTAPSGRRAEPRGNVGAVDGKGRCARVLSRHSCEPHSTGCAKDPSSCMS